jgi:hypothetical protein
VETMDVLDGSKKEWDFSNTIFHFHIVPAMFYEIVGGAGVGGEGGSTEIVFSYPKAPTSNPKGKSKMAGSSCNPTV